MRNNVVWIAYSETTFSLLFLGIGGLYEMWKLRKGKSKLVALFVLTPFIVVQLLA